MKNQSSSGGRESSDSREKRSEFSNAGTQTPDGIRPPRNRLRQAARRYGWGFGDQLFSSLTNFALSILVARTVTVEEFGSFSLVLATYLLGLGASRAVSSEPLTVRHSESSSAEWKKATAMATGSALSIGIALGLVSLLAAWIASGALRQSLVALGLVIPGLLLQDSWRFAFFAASRGDKAFVNDLVWALMLFPTLALLLIDDPPSVSLIILAWGGAATVASVVGAFQSSVAPRPSASLQWLREQRRLVPTFLAEFAATSGASQLVIYAAGAVSLIAAAALRAGQILLGPFNVLLMGVRLAVLPEAVRAAKASASSLSRISAGAALLLGAFSVGWGLFIYLLPASLGTAFLGSSWEAGHSVVLPLSIASAGSGVILGAAIGLRALLAVTRSLRARLVTAVLIVPAGAGGAALDAASGAAVGLALGSWIAAMWWWLEFVWALRTEIPHTPATDANDTVRPIA